MIASCCRGEQSLGAKLPPETRVRSSKKKTHTYRARRSSPAARRRTSGSSTRHPECRLLNDLQKCNSLRRCFTLHRRGIEWTHLQVVLIVLFQHVLIRCLFVMFVAKMNERDDGHGQNDHRQLFTVLQSRESPRSEHRSRRDEVSLFVSSPCKINFVAMRTALTRKRVNSRLRSN